MPKNSFQISNFKLKNVYGLPTLPGLVMTGILGLALWYSIFNNSNTERWIFVIMLLMFVINLLETSYSFRMIEIKALPLTPPFCEEITDLNIVITNTANIASGPIWIRSNNTKAWTRIDPIQAHQSRVITLQTRFREPGFQHIPLIRIKSYAESGLYWFWRVIDPSIKIIVLPKPVDHHIPSSFEQSNADDNELSTFEEIRDPSRFKFTDPKIFLKTQRRYQRIMHSRRSSTLLSFRWADLERLPLKQQGEQLSFWLKSIDAIKDKPDIRITMDAPFVQPGSLVNGVNLKTIFGQWFYAKI